jgi:hypothetical protein
LKPEINRPEEKRVPAYRYLTYELLDEESIARIMLNRPAARNAQNSVLHPARAEPRPLGGDSFR